MMMQLLFVCLLDELILVFCYSDLTLETGGFELASTITIVLQVNRLTKCASWSLFLIKLQASRSTTLLKRDYNTGVFLLILQKF